MPLLASRDFPLRAKSRYSACERSVMLYGSKTWPVKVDDVIRLKRNDTRMVRWMYNVRPEDSISAEKLRIGLRMMSIGNVYRTEDCSGLIIQKEWKRVLGLVNVKPSRLAVVSPEDDQRKHRMG